MKKSIGRQRRDDHNGQLHGNYNDYYHHDYDNGNGDHSGTCCGGRGGLRVLRHRKRRRARVA